MGMPRDWLPMNEEVSTGTTLVAVEFKGGVVIGADSRTSMGTWVANRVTDKLTPVTDSIFCCRSWVYTFMLTMRGSWFNVSLLRVLLLQVRLRGGHPGRDGR